MRNSATLLRTRSIQTCRLVRGSGAGLSNELNADAISTSPLRRRGTWTPITPRFGVDFQATPDLLLFASVARGSRSGGFNGRATSNVATTPYDPEFALTYEIGAKAELLDRRVRINAIAFSTDYKDLQQTVATCIRLPTGECQIGSGGLAFAPFVTNAATANIYGGELESLLARCCLRHNIRFGMEPRRRAVDTCRPRRFFRHAARCSCSLRPLCGLFEITRSSTRDRQSRTMTRRNKMLSPSDDTTPP
jgi:hypothetical protein